MALKDALSSDDPQGVLDAAEQGEDHAVKEFQSALDADLAQDARAVGRPPVRTDQDVARQSPGTARPELSDLN